MILVAVCALLLVGALAGGAAAADVQPGESIQEAINEAEEGDTIVIEQGVYDENIVVNQSHITITAEGDGAVLTAPAQDPAVMVNESVENVTIQNLGVNSTEAEAGFAITDGAADITIEESVVTLEDDDAIGYGIGGDVSDVTIEDALVDEAGNHGLYIESNNPAATPTAIAIDGLVVDEAGGAPIQLNSHDGEISDVSLNATDISAADDPGISIFSYGSDAEISDISVTNATIDGDGSGLAMNAMAEAEIRDISVATIEVTNLDTGIAVGAYDGGTVDSVYGTELLANESNTGVFLDSSSTEPEPSTIANVTVEESSLSHSNFGVRAQATGNADIDGLTVNEVLLQENYEFGLFTEAQAGGTIGDVEVEEISAVGSDIGIGISAEDDSAIERISIGGDDLDSAAALNETVRAGLLVEADDEATVAGLSLENVLLEDVVDGPGVYVSAGGDADIDDLEFSTLLAAGSEQGIVLEATNDSTIGTVSIGGDDLDSAAALNETIDAGLVVEAEDYATVADLSLENVSLENVADGPGAYISADGHAAITDLEFSTLLAAGSQQGIVLDAAGESTIGSVSIGGDDLDSAAALNETVDAGLVVEASDDAAVEGLSLENVLLEDVVDGPGVYVSADGDADIGDLEFSTLLAAGSQQGIVLEAGDDSFIGNVSIGGDDLDSAAALNETDRAGLSVTATDNASLEDLSVANVTLEDVNGTGAAVSSEDYAEITGIEFSTLLAAGSDRGIALDASGESTIGSVSIGGDDLDSAAALNETQSVGLSVEATEFGTVEDLSLENVLLEDVDGPGAYVASGDAANIDDLEFSTLLAAGSQQGIVLDAGDESSIGNVSIGGDDLDSAAGLNETEQAGLSVNADGNASVEYLSVEYVSLENVNGPGATVSSQGFATIDELSFSTLLAAGSQQGIAFDASGESSIGNVSIGGDDLDSAAGLNETEQAGLSVNADGNASVEYLSLEYVLLEDSNGSGLNISTEHYATVEHVELSSVLAAGSQQGIDITAGNESSVRNVSIGGDDMDSAVALNETDTGLNVSAFQDATVEAIELEFVLLENVNGSGVDISTADTATVTDVDVELVLAAGSEQGITANAFGESTIEGVSIQESGLNETTDHGLFIRTGDDAHVTDVTLDTVDLTGSAVGVETIALHDSQISDLTVNRVFVDGETDVGLAKLAMGGEISNTSIQESFLNATQSDGVVLVADEGGSIVDTHIEELLLTNNEGTGVLFYTNESSEIADLDVETMVAQDISGDAVTVFGNGTMDAVSFEESLIRHNDAGIVVHDEADASGIQVRDSVFRGNDVAVANHNADETIDVRLNWWGHSTGPSGDAVDPVTEKVATGEGDEIVATDENVNWSPAIGGKAEERDQFRDIPEQLDREIEIEIAGLSVEDPIELEIEGEVISGPASDFVGLSAWERSVLPLRADADDATMTVDIPDTFVRVEEGDAHINRDEAPVFTKGDEIHIGFENQAPFANTERIAGEEVQAIVLRADGNETVEDLLETDMEDDIEAQLEREFENRTEIDIDEESGDLVITSENVSIVDVQNLGELDADGEIATSLTPEEPGDYAVLLTTVETGDGFVADGDELTFNIFNDTAALVGTEYLMVQETSSTVSPERTSVEPGTEVVFEMDANLGADETGHAILVFDEEEFADRMVTIVDVDIVETDEGDEVHVDGELDGEPFELTGNLTDDRGLFTFEGAVNGEPFSMTAVVTTDGDIEEATFAGDTSHLDDVDPSGVATVTDGDEAALSTVIGERADLDPGESNTYTWVHAAVDVDNPEVRSTQRGEVTVTEEPVYDLTINAEDGDGDPLDGVAITVENDATVTAETDADGVAVVQVTNDTYTVTGELDGYEDDTATVEIDGADEEVTLVLEEDVDPDPDPAPPAPAPDEFDLTVTVVDQFSNAVEDATVTVNDEQATTDADGEATLSLEDGTYTVRADKAGYVGMTETVEIDGEDEAIEIMIVERGPPQTVPAQRLNANDASAAVNVTTGTPVSIGLPPFDIGTEDGIEFQRFNLTAIQDLDTEVTFEQTREVPAAVDEVPTRTGGTTFLSIDYEESVPDAVAEVEFVTRVSQDRLDADDREAGEVGFYRHNGTDWEALDAEVIDEDDDHVYFGVESPGLSVFATTYEEQFEIVDSTVDPTEIMQGETVDVDVTIENVGAEDETFIGDLMIDGEVVDTQEVDIPAGETADLSYTHTFEDAGEFDVELNNQFLDTVTVEAVERTLTVTVEDEAGTPLEGALVSVADLEELSDADGLATFELEDGQYQVTAELDGYHDEIETVEIDGADEAVTLTLEEEVVVPDEHELAVTVEDTDGDAIAGATVSVDGLEDTTAADGLATFELEDGEYTVTADHEDYIADSADVTIDGADEEVTLTLEEEVVEPDEHELAVTVEDADGDAIAGATVSVDGLEDTTAADGLATFELEDGEYTVTADHETYEEASVDVTIDGADEEVTITLEEDEFLPTWAIALIILVILAAIAAAIYYYAQHYEA